MSDKLISLGHAVSDAIWRLSFASRFFRMTICYSGMALRRLHLTIREIYFSGVLRLLFIMVSIR